MWPLPRFSFTRIGRFIHARITHNAPTPSHSSTDETWRKRQSVAVCDGIVFTLAMPCETETVHSMKCRCSFHCSCTCWIFHICSTVLMEKHHKLCDFVKRIVYVVMWYACASCNRFIQPPTHWQTIRNSYVGFGWKFISNGFKFCSHHNARQFQMPTHFLPMKRRNASNNFGIHYASFVFYLQWVTIICVSSLRSKPSSCRHWNATKSFNGTITIFLMIKMHKLALRTTRGHKTHFTHNCWFIKEINYDSKWTAKALPLNINDIDIHWYIKMQTKFCCCSIPFLLSFSHFNKKQNSIFTIVGSNFYLQCKYSTMRHISN